MRKYDLTIRGNDYHVELLSFEDGTAKLEVNGTPFKVEVKNRQVKTTKTPVLVRRAAEKPAEEKKEISPASAGLGAVRSPLPGTILNIKVNVGDEVKTGDTLLIMEAMKMENDIQSEVDGKVTAVKVKENDNVLEGDILVEIGG